MGRLVLCKVRIELLKIPLFIELIEEALENDYSVVMFVNYRETISKISKHFEKRMGVSVVEGGQSVEFREQNIQDFQCNKKKLIICSITAGGVGISLHDLHGNHPRQSIISPTWSGQDLVQAVGRIHRAGSKTPALQKIVYCAKTFEEKICKLIDRKLKTISGINSGDLRQLDIEEIIMNIEDKDADEYKLLSADEFNIISHNYVH